MPERGASRPQWLVAIAVAAALLLIVAIVNGYPIVFYDSADYIEMSFTGDLVVYRTMPYALTIMKLHLGQSLWLVIVAQALLAAWVVRETCAAFAPATSPVAYLALMAALCVVTSLPWYAGQLMPDFFVGLVALCVLILAFDRSLSPARRCVLVAIAVLGGIAHASLMLLLVAVTLVALALYWLLRRAAWRAQPLPLLIAAISTMAAVPALHYVATGRAFYSQSGDIFLVARLIQDGIAKKYLDAVCPTPELKLCAFKDRLPATANDYLWHVDSIFGAVGSWEHSGPESRKIVVGSLRMFPLDHVRSAIGLSLRQLVEFRTGDGNDPQIEATPFIINRYFPAEIAAYQGALQQHGRFDFDAINRLHVPVAALAQVLLLALAVLQWRRGDRLGPALCLAALAILVLQAAITGALSNPNHRYQSRLVWVAPLMVYLAWMRLWSGRADGNA